MSEPAAGRIAVVMTCHNRRNLTVRCLESIRAQDVLAAGQSAPEVRVFLLDDGSRDGTAEAARGVFPEAVIIQGDGTLFWCGGMRRAWGEAARQDPDFYWLVNDDTVMFPFALRELLAICGGASGRTIAVGAVADPATGRQVYGGWRQRGRSLVAAAGREEECETMNANCALVPREVYRRAGIFHTAYTHAMGDFDYGNAARRKGCRVVQTGRIVAACRANSEQGTWRDRELPRARRWRLLLSPKGLPPREWLVYTRRNEGVLWPLRFASPYLRVLCGL